MMDEAAGAPGAAPAWYGLSDDDVELLGREAPLMTYDPRTHLITGRLDFSLKYTGAERGAGKVIRDGYLICIDLNRLAGGAVPAVREIGGRIADIARKRGVPLSSLCVSPDMSLNMMHPSLVKERYPHGFNLLRLLHGVQEYLYWVSYFDECGEAPWDACAAEEALWRARRRGVGAEAGARRVPARLAPAAGLDR